TCGISISNQIIRYRRAQNRDWLRCSACDTHINITEHIQQYTMLSSHRIQVMDYAADKQRERETAQSILQGKIATGDFDVFLCHNTVDKHYAKHIGKQLKEQGILPWLDEWELQPGLPWQKLLEEQIERIKSAAVFVGRDGLGPWQNLETMA